jgi:PPM family protein phosphatase
MSLIENAEIKSYGFTHVGKVRQENEDSLRLCDPEDEFTKTAGHLYGIADGMGGYALGSTASSLALETFFDTVYDSNGATPVQKFKAGIQNANLSVYQTAQKLGVGRMGTTLTAVNIVGKYLYIGHVGDSRAYLVRDKKATCLTNDHSRVGELVRMKVLSPEKIRTHSQRSVLNKCLGFNLFIQPDVFKVSIQDKDLIILCTDGVWSVIEDDEFAKAANSTKDPGNLSREIVELALSREHDDNLSVIAIYLNKLIARPESKDQSEPGFLSGIFRRFIK